MSVQWDTRIRLVETDHETYLRQRRLAKQQRNVYQKCPPWAIGLVLLTTGLLVGVWARILWLACQSAANAISGLVAK